MSEEKSSIGVDSEFLEGFKELPGVGEASARRMVHYLFKNPGVVTQISLALHKISTSKRCRFCGMVSIKDVCPICSSTKRNGHVICVVENMSDVTRFEGMGIFNGIYHVLGGALSAVDGVYEDDLRIKELYDRLQKEAVQEVILATSTTFEGETTANFLGDAINSMKIQNLVVSRIATGIPMGVQVEAVTQTTLKAAFARRNIL